MGQPESSDAESSRAHEDASSAEAGVVDAAFSEQEIKKILRKVDLRLLPLLALLYVLSFLDRSNFGNARVAGMNEDLGLTGGQYNLCLTLFVIPYALLEVPSNVVLKLLTPSIWISCLMIAWGTVLTLTGIVQNFSGLAVARVALGVAEAGFFPAASYLLTIWYRRLELQTRMALFYSAASFAGAFSGLLAFGLQQMDGIAGLGGWRWIFILEGIFTVVIGVLCFWALPDSPESASFLTPKERAFLVERLRADAGTEGGTVDNLDKFHWPTMKSVLLEWKIWVAIVVYWGNSVSIYGFTNTAPQVILELGYSSANAQLLTIPIYFVALVLVPIISWYADRHETRWPFIVGPYCIAMIGFIGLLASPHPGLPGLTYFWLFWIPVGIYPPLIGILSWIANNLAPSWKRAVGMALLVSIGNLGGIVGSNIYLAKQAPQYYLGYGFGVGLCLAAIGATMILKVAYERLNHEKEKLGSVDEVRAKFSEQELSEMGDKSPLFRYIV